MSFAELASELASSEKDSPKFTVLEREIKRHLAKDQAKINLPNMLFAACVGGFFALAGVVLGAYLRDSPSFEKITPASSVQKISNGALSDKPKIANASAGKMPIHDHVNKPVPKQSNEQPRN